MTKTLQNPKSGWKWPIRILVFLVVLFLLIMAFTKQFNNFSEDTVPKFIQANIVDPNLVTYVSKFRSGAGHSNPGWPETCRSMKHYIQVYDPSKHTQPNFKRAESPSPDYAVDIFSPINGRLTKSATGEGDDQLNISVDSARGFSIRFEHVHLLPSIGAFNTKVTAGEKIATVWNNQNFDLSVAYHYFQGDELFSYFQVLPNDLFAPWKAQGAASPSQFIFTKDYRDAHPLTCLNDRPGTPSFSDANGKVTENWVPENFVRFKPDHDPSQP